MELEVLALPPHGGRAFSLSVLRPEGVDVSTPAQSQQNSELYTANRLVAEARAEVERLRDAIATHRAWITRNREIAGTPTEGDERLWDALTSTGKDPL